MKRKRLNRDSWGFQLFPYYQMRIDCDFFHGQVCYLNIIDGEKQYWEMPRAGKTAVCGKGMSWLQLIPDGTKRVITTKYFADGIVDPGRKNYPLWARENCCPSIWYVDVIEDLEYDEDGIAVFVDKYLDVIFSPEGDVKVDDRDELDAAYESGELSKTQYEEALREGESIQNDLCKDIEATAKWCAAIRKIVEKKIEKDVCIEKAKWIGTDLEVVCPSFFRDFNIDITKKIKKAYLFITAIGVYEAYLNGRRIGDFILAPGLTSYTQRLQFQKYDITDSLQSDNRLEVLLGPGWYRGRISEKWKKMHETSGGIRAGILITYEDQSSKYLLTDDAFRVKASAIVKSDLYDGEMFDALYHADEEESFPVKILADVEGQELIFQENEYIKEHEHIMPKEIIHTPKGELVVDFGQNVAGYVSFHMRAKAGETLRYRHIEVLDAQGNAYFDNYRSAKAEIDYRCKEGEQSYKPHFCFTGFRYIVIEEKPAQLSEEQILSGFEAIAIYTDMERTGHMISGNLLLNKLYENTLWSQRANFIDVPTDCPQRDERLGWTGDAQVFCKTAAYNYNVKAFFEKWCRDLRAEQRENGSIPDTVPNFWRLTGSSAAWGDVICVVPWQMYLAYGDKTILEENFDAMHRWVDYMTADTTTQYLWTCSDEDKQLWKKHYGDWLALDAPEGSYKGSTRDDFISSAFYLYSTRLVVKAGHVIGRDVSDYETLAGHIEKTFRETFPTYTTQTEHVLALFMGLSASTKETAAALAEDIRNNGCRMKTGFVGTPYLLHALGENGYYELCYDLLLQEEFPSWLFSVKQGATTIWEHWDGRKADGSFWSADMNSFNHYAYGSVFDWVYGVAAGICPVEEAPGYEKVTIMPHPDPRLGFLDVSLQTKHGLIRSSWSYEGDNIRYHITTPVLAVCIINGKRYEFIGDRTFWHF